MEFISNPSSTSAGNAKLHGAIDCEIDFCFDDDFDFKQNAITIESGIQNFPNKVSEAPTIALSKPANCVVTKDSVKAELLPTKTCSAQSYEKEANFNGFIDQIFEVNHDITITNCNLVSKYSDLQVENIDLLETIAQMKTNHSQEIANLQNVFKKAKNENYEMSLTNADLTLSNVEYRRETVQLREENHLLRQKQTMPAPLNQVFHSGKPNKVFEKTSLINKDLSAKLQHVTAEFKDWKNENNLSKNQQELKLHSYQLQLQILKNENADLKYKLKRLPSTQNNNSQETLLERLAELREIQNQFSKDTKFIRKAQTLQIDKENCLSSLTCLQRDYDELKRKFTVLQVTKNFSADSNNSSIKSSISPGIDKDIFDGLTPQTNSTEKTFNWRRLYKKGSLSPSNWTLKFAENKFFRSLAG